MTEAADALRRVLDRALARVAPAGPVARTLAGLDLAAAVTVLAVGKAAASMMAGALEALGDRVDEAIAVVPAGSPREALVGSRTTVLDAAHPVPDARSELAGRALLAAAARVPVDHDLVVLISGGGSALAAVPQPGLALADKAEAIARLMAAGAPIGELNTVRRHLSAIKGGRLARASAARVTTLVVSDVVGDALHEVASGPTVPDPTELADARAILERHLGAAGVPPSVWQRIEAGGRAHRIPNQEDAAAARRRDRAILVLGLGALVDAARVEAAAAWPGRVETIAAPLVGPVDEVASSLATSIRSLAARGGGTLVAGGEPTLAVRAGAGRSGRAHHLALLLARAIAAPAGGPTILVVGSDGVDGASDAAGAVVDAGTWQRIGGVGLDPDEHLGRFDAAAALAGVGAQVTTGPTGVNHADLVIARVDPIS